MLVKKINCRDAARSSSSSSSLYYNTILKFIEDCRKEPDKDKRNEMLIQINSMLLRSDQLSIPSQFTSEYVNVALNKIEGSLLLLNGSK
ncbi:MAG: hypothetical protein JO297_08680 [Nitrososphaeraceae archaeon]|nr:hypothetical protein [Nitrososphaeraceae archaeon]